MQPMLMPVTAAHWKRDVLAGLTRKFNTVTKAAAIYGATLDLAVLDAQEANMSGTRKIVVAATAAVLALVASAPAEAERLTACTALDICYCVNTDYLGAIAANVSRVRQLIADNRAKGKAVGYLSVPLSSAGGGSFQINSEAAEWIAGAAETRFGQSSAWLLNPGAEGSDAMKGAGGADYMYMWTQILEGRSGHGEDFDFFYFAGPTDFSRYFLRPEKDSKDQKNDPGQVEDYFGKLNDFFDKRVANDPDFKKAVEQGQISKVGFRNYYGLRASVAFSYGSHDEWNIARLLNERRRGAADFGIANQLPVFFDGQPVNPGGFESVAASGDTGRCIK
jgi:hypothetical protein